MPDKDKTYKITGSLKADVHLFDSIDGDRDLNAHLNVTSLAQGDNRDIQGEYDISSLLELLFRDDYGYLYEDEIEMIKSASRSGFELIMDAGSGKMYIKYPFLGMLTGLSGKADWFSMYYPVEDFAFFESESLSIGNIIYESNLSSWLAVYPMNG